MNVGFKSDLWMPGKGVEVTSLPLLFVYFAKTVRGGEGVGKIYADSLQHRCPCFLCILTLLGGGGKMPGTSPPMPEHGQN